MSQILAGKNAERPAQQPGSEQLIKAVPDIAAPWRLERLEQEVTDCPVSARQLLQVVDASLLTNRKAKLRDRFTSAMMQNLTCGAPHQCRPGS